MMVFGGQTNQGNFHYVAFDEESIKRHLNKAGFTIVEFVEEDISQAKDLNNLHMTIKAVKQAKTEQSKNTPINIFSDNKMQNNTPPTAKLQPVQGKHLNIV
jgi:uncharacterized protein Smg (DUF494 family)